MQRSRNLSPNKRRLLLAYLMILHIRERLTPPLLVFSRNVRPVQFGIVTTLIMFALLPILPRHPITIPLSFGAGLSITYILTAVRALPTYQADA